MAVPRLLLLVVASLVALAGCDRAPAEPDGPSASSASSTVAPLLWDAPSTWNRLDVAGGSPRKAAYHVPPAGNDTEEAEVDIHFFGTGAAGDPAVVFKEWFDQFDGDVGATAAREKIPVGSLEVETVEVSGTYKLALARAPRGKKQAAVQMVKKGFRLYAAVVRTKDRGNWFFKLVGPSDTVQAARSAFRRMIESAR